jgi:predicted alpha/beta hydrolase
VSGQPVAFQATDGFALSGHWFGDAASARAGVLLVPAMGVAQRFYADLGEWLAAHDLLVLSFDYRGIGASRPAGHARSLRGLKADVLAWAERDVAAALALMAQALGPQRPIHWLGHSLGGQIFALVPGHERVSSVMAVAAGSGYFGHYPPRLRRQSRWLWWVVAPAAVALAGYFPGRRLRMLDDLPAGAIRQWRRWCLSPEYLMSEGGRERRERYAAVRTPMLVMSFTDDEYMSAPSIDALHGWYAGAPRQPRRIAPAQAGLEGIGHFGFFRERTGRQRLWPELLHWIDRQETA